LAFLIILRVHITLLALAHYRVLCSALVLWAWESAQRRRRHSARAQLQLSAARDWRSFADMPPPVLEPASPLGVPVLAQNGMPAG